MRDRHILIAAVIAAIFCTSASAQTNWEGTAVVGEYDDFPPGGMYAASNSFPLNSMVDITSTASGMSGRVIIVRTVDDPGVFVLLSTTAADALSIDAGESATVRARPVSLPGLTAVDPNQDLPYHPDPDINPSASLGDPNQALIAPQGFSTSIVAEAEPEPEPEPEEPVAETPIAVEPKETREQPSVVRPRATAPAEEVAVTPDVLPFRRVPSPPVLAVALASPEVPPINLADAADAAQPGPPIVSSPAVDLPVVAPPALRASQISLPLVVDRSVPEVAEIMPPDPGMESLPVTILPFVRVEEEVEPGDLLRVEPEANVVISVVLAEPVDETVPEAEPEPPEVPAEEIVEVANQPATDPVDAEGTKPTFVPGETVISFEPADFRSPDVPESSPEPEVVAEAPPAKEGATARTPSDVQPSDLPLIRSLERDAYYLQVAAFSNLRSVQTTINTLGDRYPVAVLSESVAERPIYRVFVGPLSADERGSALFAVRNKGYRDAFVRSATP